ncbi:hypothetical protein [Lacinutrix mariniflava]|nr:hypothetical protein [Lacinutrix mariniflava]
MDYQTTVSSKETEKRKRIKKKNKFLTKNQHRHLLEHRGQLC